MGIALDAGAEDIRDEGDSWGVISDPNSHEAVLGAIQKAGLETVAAEVGMIPKNLMELEGKNAAGMVRLLEALEDQDDVQNVYSNFDSNEEDVDE
jgi:transcriptional/translational regulatory protein YebC/TACO1